MRIAKKLFISHFTAMLLPIIVLSAIFFMSARSSLKYESIQKLGVIADLKVRILNTVFSELKQDISGAQDFYNIQLNLPVIIGFKDNKTDPSYINAIKMLDAQLSGVKDNSELLRIKLLDKDGKVAYSFDGKRHLGPEADTGIPEIPKGFLRAEGRGRIWSSDIYKWSGNFAMMMAAPAYDLERHPIGFIVFEINMAPIYNNIQDVTGLGDTGETLIGRKAGDEVLYLNTLRNDKDAALNKKIRIGEKIGIPLQKAVQGESGQGVSMDYRGKKVISAWRYMPSLDWGLVSKIDADEAFAPIVRLRTHVIWFMVFTAAFAVTVSFFIAKTLADPIHELQRGAGIISGGNLDHKIPVRSSDEVGELTGAFNNMTIELKQYQDRVVRSEKLAVIGLLASSVAHELRNPLGVMKNVLYYFDMLKLGDSDPDIKENLGILSQEIESSDRIISDLLEFSRIKKPIRRRENINILVGEVLDRTPKNPFIEVAREFSVGLPEIEVDAIQMRQVFYNLIKNAMEAIGKSGKLFVRTYVDNGSVKISFADTGCGISRENLGKIFEPLFSTKIKGTGLGLSVCSSIIEGHDGKIEVESEPGRGTTVTVRFPIERA